MHCTAVAGGEVNPAKGKKVGAEVKLLDSREVVQMGPQRFGTIGTDSVVDEVKLLDGCKVGQMGPQRLDTLVTNIVATEVKLLDGRWWAR